jgi:CRP-like cAMP-binding protein
MADNTIELLRRVDPFTRLSEPDLRRVARVVKSRRLHPNQVLFRQGERADALYVVSSGRLRVSASDRPGHERILAFLGPGELRHVAARAPARSPRIWQLRWLNERRIG